MFNLPSNADKLKPIVLLLLLTFLLPHAFAQDTNLFPDRPGTYVVYEDTRFGDHAYIGICFLGESSIALRTYSPESGATMVLSMDAVLESEGWYAFDNLRLLGGEFMPDAAAERSIPMLLNWLNGWSRVRHRLESEDEFVYTVDDTFAFRREVPLLNIATVDPDHEQTAEAITAGVLTTLDDPRFLRFTGYHDVLSGPRIELGSATRNEVILGSITVPLSPQWTRIPQGFIVSEVTPQDAVIQVETAPKDALPRETHVDVARLLLFGESTGMVLLQDARIEEVGKSVVVKRRIVDLASNQVSTNVNIIGGIDDKTVGIVSIATFEAVWNLNEALFQRIVDAVVQGMVGN